MGSEMCIRDRTYDANTDALAADITLSNLVSGETLNHSGTATLSSANAGSYTISNLTGISLADNAGLASNYTLTGGTHNFTVNQKAISLSGTRLYDATTDAVASDLTTISGRVGTETLTLSGTGSVANVNVASNKTVTVGTLALGDGTGLAANYTLSGGTHQLTINQRPLNATLARQYDGTATSAGSTLSSFDALQGGETLTMSGSGTAASVNVANGIAMSSNGDLGLVDGTGLASNYSLNSTVINITQRVLNSSGSKIYDANTNALAADITLSNLVSGETLNHSGTATLSSANAGSYTISNLTGISIADNAGLASNYTLTGGTHNFTVNPKVVSIQGNKTYDGNTTISSSDITSITGTVGSETLVMSSGTGTTSSQNAATYTSADINEGSLTLGDGSNGGLAANYTLTGHAASSFQINQRVLSSSGTRTYDGTATASSSDLTLSNLVGSETLTLSGNGTLADANVATNKTVTLNTLTLSDNSGLAANYTLTGGTHQLTINQKAVNTSGTRNYDSTTVVGSGTLTVSGEVGSEQVTITGNGSITDKNVGSGKTINTSGLTLQDGSGGGLASNYTLSAGTHTYSVTQAPISFTGTRTYNATTNVEATNITLTGQQGGEDLTVTGVGSITSGNVGSGKTANVTGLTLGDGVSGTPGTATNYTFTGGTQTFDVTQAPLTISGSREYDGTQKIESSSMSLSGLQGGEALAINDSILTTSSNVGTYSTGTSTYNILV